MESLLGEIMDIFLYISFMLLVSGIAIFSLKDIHQKIYWRIAYFSSLLFFEILSYKLSAYNLFIFSITSFVHFAFLIHFYFKNFLSINYKKAIFVIIVGAVPMMLGLTSGYTILDFQSYDRAIYSFVITLLSLYYFYLMLDEETKMNRASIILNVAVLLFFSIETFLAVSTNYLVNANMIFGAWFWFFRALFLQFYYGSIIYYSWQNGSKIP